MIVLYILAGLLLLLLLPLTSRFQYKGDVRYVLRWAGIPVYKYRPKEKNKSKTKTKKSDSNSKKSTPLDNVRKSGVGAVLRYLRGISECAVKAGKRFAKVIRFGNCTVRIAVGGEDAAAIAIRYGQLCAPFYMAKSVLQDRLHIRRLSLDMYPDYAKDKDDVSADISFWTVPLCAVWALGGLFFSFIRMTMKFSKESEDVSNG